MDKLVNFLMEYYLYIVIIALFFILALIGYTVDTVKSNRLKKEYEKMTKEETLDIPVAGLDGFLSDDNKTTNEAAKTPVALKSDSSQD